MPEVMCTFRPVSLLIPQPSVLTVVAPQTKHSPIMIPVKLVSHSAKNGESAYRRFSIPSHANNG